MHCHICDKLLTDKEIVYDKETQEFEPCRVCMEIILDAAYVRDYLEEDEYEMLEELDIPHED